jgi:hypothetical protein
MRMSIELRAWAVVALAIAVTGCGNRRSEKHEPPRDAQRPNRVIEPSTDRVGPLPPYAIRGDAVGPYKLGEKLADLLEQLESGPRVELFEIAGVVHRNVIRAEDDAILIGGEQASTASFVAVIGGEVARTEAGVHVGSTREELVRALGPSSDPPERARDPRLVVPSGMPGLRAVMDGTGDDAKVSALVVAAVVAPPRSQPACARPASTERGVGACMSAGGELIQVGDDEIAIRSADGERALVAPFKVPGLVFAAPLRVIGEARDELVVVMRSDEPSARSWSVTAYRLDGARLTRSVDATPVYQLSTGSARWIGADVRDVELYLELTGRVDGIDVGGLLTTRGSAKAATKFRDVVVISGASVARRRGKAPASEPGDAGVPAAPRVTQDAASDGPAPADEPDAP